MESTQLEAAAQVVELPLEVVRHVLWHLGDQNLGEQPGSFVELLLRTIEHADAGNRLKLSLVFEGYVNAVRAAQQVGIEALRDRVLVAEALPVFDVVTIWRIDEELDEHVITGYRARKLHQGVQFVGDVRETRAEAEQDILAVFS